MGNGNLYFAMLSGGDVDFAVNGFLKYKLFGQELWLTTTHVCLLIIMVTIILLAIIANRIIKKADPNEVPGPVLNVIELVVESIDKMTLTNMGEKHGYKFANYIGTLFIFIILSNISGVFGLRPPTADYGVTFALGVITFILIHYNGFKYQKVGHITGLFKPLLLSPINIIGEIAVPLSLSLRLFGNILSGTVLLALVYGLIPKLLVIILTVPMSALHVYFDLFSGGIQTYVFCMLTMVYISQTFEEEAA